MSNLKKIEDFLAQFKLIEDPEKEKLKIVENINNCLGTQLTKDNINVKNKTVQIIVHPAVKSLIFINRQEIIKKIEENLQKNNITIFFK